MKYRLSKRAERQLHQIHKFISKDKPDAAADTIRQILRSFERLADYPKLGHPGRHAGSREFVQPSFVIVYRIGRERLEISAIFHGKQQYD